MTHEEQRIYLIQELLAEDARYHNISIPSDEQGQKDLLRSLMNVRMPKPISSNFLAIQDAYLQEERDIRGVTDSEMLPSIPGDPRIVLWQGDITTLKVDTIVNAANSAMLGCFHPLHSCIDNIIGTMSGTQLRLYCYDIMRKQGHEEPTGQAKITPAFNLPSKYILHTVGPIIRGAVRRQDCDALASCYRACLELAVESCCKSIAFCCISTGAFRFPHEKAAKIAVQTVTDFLNTQKPDIRIIFNVFKDADLLIYQKLLGGIKMLNTVTGATQKQAEFQEELRQAVEEASAVLIGAGAGLSTAAGFTYGGERFRRYFADFERKYGFHDMYSGGFYPFDTLEEFWAYWSRQIFLNRYTPAPKPVYQNLLELIRNKDYFVLTTNVDHQFQKAGFDKGRLFYTQGDYGLWQCSRPCHDATYDNEDVVRQMVEAQGYRIIEGDLELSDGAVPKMVVPTQLVPRCPKCGRPMTTNLRVDNTFVQDDGWYAAARRYDQFIRRHRKGPVLYLELGVGMNTPGIVKFPFWQMTARNPQAKYVCVNQGQSHAPREIADRSLCLDVDLAQMLAK